ncbi:MAG: protein nirF [Gammaproteobacteria bacterium RBG_16_57_12]|nr:MAG: protein nirF [Gammaproteobacteria bacterium RBG_16_57_12]
MRSEVARLDVISIAALCLLLLLGGCAGLRGTGDMGVVIEREAGRVLVVETTGQSIVSKVQGLGNLSHASVVYSRDARYAYVFGREGGLSKVDILRGRVVKRIVQAGNSIGGAISQDGRLVAVANYEPGGVKVFDADTLEPVADIPAVYGDGGQRSKVVGLVDAPGQRFVFSLWDAGEIWVVDMQNPAAPQITKFKDIGKNPYDDLLTPDGRYYAAGLFGENGLALLDLWHPEAGVTRIMQDYGRGDEPLPVFKMPHLEGWAIAGNYMFVPAIGHHEVIVFDTRDWKEVKRIPVYGQPVFVMARPDGRQIWVNFAVPNNEKVQVIDAASLDIIQTLTPGKGVLHLEFTPRGEHIWISVRDEDRVKIYDTATFKELKSLPADKPSGIFFTTRAHKIGL